MNPLQLELDRLYGLGASAAHGDTPAAAQGVRALVLALRPPAGWAELSTVWTGVQSDLGLPAPAIAVSGVDEVQLWFSLAAPTSPGAGALFLQRLRARYLPDVGSAYVRLLADAAHRRAAPPLETGPDRWSAFVAPDLASVFAETPWLDFPPNLDGQAALLRALAPIPQAAFEIASGRLGGSEAAPAELTPSGATEIPASPSCPTAEQPGADAERFLRSVMNDASVPMALRIDAAKGLLGVARRS